VTNEQEDRGESRAPAAPEGAPPRPEAPARTEERPGGPPPRRGGGGRGRFGGRRKVCAFCVDKIDVIDYKDPLKLRRYVSDRGKIEPRRKTGTCARHQRRLTVAIKRARHLALLPYTADHIRTTGAFGPPPRRGDDRPRREEERRPAPAAEQPEAVGQAEEQPSAEQQPEQPTETAPAEGGGAEAAPTTEESPAETERATAD
jgi:small subunit ribosomal protein S18